MLKSETQKLLNALEKGITKEEGDVQVNVDGERYRYDRYRNRYNSTPYYLELLFNAAAKANGKEFSNQFNDGDYIFHFARARYKGEKHGNIDYSKLVVL